MDIVPLAVQLSAVFPSPATQRAAISFLSLPDASAALGRIYNFLVWHHTLRTALGHLEAAGADLAALEVPIEAFRDTFVHHGPAVWNLDVGARITAQNLLEIYALQSRLLTEPIEQLADAGVDCFTLISGRAYHVRYPHYEYRVEFDSDIVAPDIPAALAIMAALEPKGFALERLSVQRFGESPSAKFMLQRRELGHRASVDILIGGYHAHRGAIYERSDALTSGGRVFRTARPEDMLVMLAARTERKRRFSLASFNDAAIVLDTEGSALSWDLVCDVAAASGLEATLTVLLRRAELLLDEPRVPDMVWKKLEAGRGSAARRKLTERVADAHLTLGSHRRGDATDIAIRTWRAAVQARQQRRGDTPAFTSRALVTIQRRILLKQIRAITSGRPLTRGDHLMAGTRTRSGTFCEVSSHLAATHGCVALQSGWHGSTAARLLLTDLASHLKPKSDPHDCARLQFHLWSEDGI